MDLDSLAIHFKDLKLDQDFGTLVHAERIEKGCTQCEFKLNLPPSTTELTIVFGKEDKPVHQYKFVYTSDLPKLTLSFPEKVQQTYIVRVFAKCFIE